MLVRIRFVCTGSNTLLGNFESDDIARVPPALARHLVDEARCAKYEQAPAPARPEPPPARRRRTRSA